MSVVNRRVVSGLVVIGIALTAYTLWTDRLDDGIPSTTPAASTSSGPDAPPDVDPVAATAEPTPVVDVVPEPVRDVAPTRRLLINVSTSGTPIPGAELVVLPMTDEVATQLDDPAGLSTAIRDTATWLHTDDQGDASMERPEGELYLAVRADGIAPGALFCPPDEDEVLFTVVSEYSITGRVTLDGGRPAAGAHVTGRMDVYYGNMIRGWTAEPYRMLGMFFTSTTTAAADGTYRLGGLPMGFIEVRASLPGFSSAVDPLVDVPVRQACDLVLHPGAALSGAVVDAKTGRPVEGARLVASSAPASLTDADVADVAYSDPEGRFSLPGVRAGVEPFALKIIRNGYAAEVLDVAGLAPGASRDMRIELSRADELRGVVVSRSGTPVPLARVRVIDESKPFLVDILNTREADGSFRIGFLAPGRRYTITAQRRLDDPPTTLTGVTVPRPDDLELVLERSGLLQGEVVADGAPVTKGSVHLLVLGARRMELERRRADLDDDGRYTFDLVPEGEHRIDVVADGYAPKWIEPVRVIAAAEETTVDVTLEQGAALIGTVIDADTRAPLPDVRLVAFSMSTTGSDWPEELPVETSSDETGRFRFDHLPVDVPCAIGPADDRFARTTTPVTIPSHVAEHEVEIDVVLGVTVEIAPVTAGGTPPPGYGGNFASEGLSVSDAAPDPDGVVRIPRVKPGDAIVGILYGSLSSYIARQRAVQIPAGSRVHRIEFRLDTMGEIHGSVGRLIHNNSTFAVSAREARMPRGSDVYNVVRGGNAYALDAMPAGRYELTARSVSGTPYPFEATRHVDLADGQRLQVDFDFGAGAIAGDVADSGGEPLADVRASLSANADGSVTTTSLTDARGEYRLAGFGEPGGYSVLFSRQGLGRVRRDVDVLDASDDVALDVTMEPEAVLLARVIDRAGSPVQAAHLECWPSQDPHPSLHVARTAVASLEPTRITQLTAGEHTLSVTADGYFDLNQRIPLRPGETTTVDLVMRRPCVAEFKVFLSSGAPAPYATITLTPEFDRPEFDGSVDAWVEQRRVESSTGSTQTDRLGRLRLSGIPEGRYRVVAAGVSRELDVTAAEPAAITLHGTN